MIRILFIHYNIKGARLKTIFKTHLNLKIINLTSTGLLWLSSSGVVWYAKIEVLTVAPLCHHIMLVLKTMHGFL